MCPERFASSRACSTQQRLLDLASEQPIEQSRARSSYRRCDEALVQVSDMFLLWQWNMFHDGLNMFYGLPSIAVGLHLLWACQTVVWGAIYEFCGVENICCSYITFLKRIVPFRFDKPPNLDRGVHLEYQNSIFRCRQNLKKRIDFFLSAIGYCPLAIGNWLLAIGCWILALGYWLLVIGYSLAIG